MVSQHEWCPNTHQKFYYMHTPAQLSSIWGWQNVYMCSFQFIWFQWQCDCLRILFNLFSTRTHLTRNSRTFSLEYNMHSATFTMGISNLYPDTACLWGGSASQYSLIQTCGLYMTIWSWALQLIPVIPVLTLWLSTQLTGLSLQHN